MPKRLNTKKPTGNQRKIDHYFSKLTSPDHNVTASKFTQIVTKPTTHSEVVQHGTSPDVDPFCEVILITPGRRNPLRQKVMNWSPSCLDECEIIAPTQGKDHPCVMKENVNFLNVMPDSRPPKKLKLTLMPEKSCVPNVGGAPDTDCFNCMDVDWLYEDNFRPEDDKSIPEKDNSGVRDDLLIKKYGRHTVKKVIQSCPTEKVLVLWSTFDNTYRNCVLKGYWARTSVKVGDTVNLLAKVDELGNIVLGGPKKEGLLVINPDFLLSVTTVVSGVFCLRKTVLDEWFRSSSSGTVQMLVGKLIHELFQEAMQQGLSSPQQLRDLLRDVKTRPKNIREIYQCQGDFKAGALDLQLEKFLKPISSWILAKGTSDVKITGVLDIEENVWCPRLGLKGKPDMVVEAEKSGKKNIVPLELKTGRASFSSDHQGQVKLYEMIARDRRPETIGRGLLLYLATGECREVSCNDNERQHLVMLRNEITSHVAQPLDQDETGRMQFALLPEPFSETCENCSHLTICSVFHQKEGRPQPTFDALSKLTTQHLRDSEREYFFRWCRNVFLEDLCTKDKMVLKDVWCCKAEKRENRGECFSGMILEQAAKGVGNVHRFRRCDNHWKSKESLMAIGLTASQSVVVSVEKRKLLAISTGKLKDVKDTFIDVQLNKDLYANNKYANDIFRIDAYTPHIYSVTSLGNLARLMAETPESERLRKIITGKQKSSEGKRKQDIIEQPFFRGLEQNQREVVLKAYVTENYMLVEGMPGCGKTTTIVALIQMLLASGHTILLTSHTHSAVDNVLLKLKAKGVDNFLRLGKLDKVHDRLAANTDDYLVEQAKSLEQLNKIFNSKKLVATTCLGTNHALFKHRKSFDYCIIDEATQVLQPVTLGPLFLSKRFILFGDSKQLPPVVRSKDAKKEGMDESLFLHLQKYSPAMTLHVQFRMNEEIMNLANKYVYEGQLKCNNKSIRDAVLTLPTVVTVSNTWLKDVASTSMVKSVLLLNTEQLVSRGGLETMAASKTYNSSEAVIVLGIVKFLLKSKLKGEQVGVITPYRKQVDHIRRELADVQEGSDEREEYAKVEVNTVDQFQGKDKDVIIISFVRSTKDTPDTQDDEILNDKRRINVAITRAKIKLVMIGNCNTIKAYQPINQLIGILKDEHKITLPPECLPFDSGI